ncbi:MAG: FecR domain-containing protein [Ginsengibacter sp.]
MEENKNIQELFQRYLDNNCTTEEIKSLFDFFGKEENEEQLRAFIREQLPSQINQKTSPQESKEKLLNTVLLQIKKAISEDEKISRKVTPFYQHKWFRASAAAVVFVLLSSTAFLLFRQNKEIVLVQNQTKTADVKDIAPGNNNAILTLNDGTTILLDSVANGNLAQQGNSNVSKVNDQITYQEGSSNSLNSVPVYNTITTANSNQYRLTLSDGTKVWLNAASSIRFPSSFPGKERKVEITGEVYFEVAKNAQKRFKVLIPNRAGKSREIEVLGTHFNVNAYDNEPEIKTTLLEGSVRISQENRVEILSPGQQAQMTSEGIKIKKNADLEQVMAWKNGYFLFNNTDLHTLMRQVARWYNVDVSFGGTANTEGFSGKISRDVPLSDLLKALELNEVNIKRVGRNLMVKP